MKKFLPLFLALALAIGAPRIVRAQDIADTPENRQIQATRYLAATPPAELINEVAKNVTASAPAAQRDQLMRAFSTGLDMNALTKAMNDALVKTFTAQELKALADFYSSPVGKSAMSKMGTYMMNVMPAMQAQMMKAFSNSSKDATGQ